MIFFAQNSKQSPDVRVILALGAIAHAAVLRAMRPGGRRSIVSRMRAEHALSGGRVLLDSYHCSRYNTQTRRLTTAMFEASSSERASSRSRRSCDECRPSAPFDAKAFVDSLPARPGVYRMLDAQGEILYVGKARNLKSRVGSYFQAEQRAAEGPGAGRQDRRAWKSRSRIPTPKRCCSNSISSRSTGRASTWCCATTRAFPTCIWRPGTNFRA